MSYEVGQSVCVVSTGHRHSSPARIIDGVVEKVGRKWVTVQAGSDGYKNLVQFSVENGAQNTEYAPSYALYLSRSHYEAQAALSGAWSRLKRRLSNLYSMPEGMTIERISKVTDILFGEEENTNEL